MVDYARTIIWQMGNKYAHRFILAPHYLKWRLLGKGEEETVEFTVLLVQQPPWHNLSTFNCSWSKKITHPLKLGTLLRRMTRNLSKHWKKFRTKVQFTGKNPHHCKTPKHCHIELHEHIILEFILTPCLLDSSSQQTQLEEKVGNLELSTTHHEAYF